MGIVTAVIGWLFKLLKDHLVEILVGVVIAASIWMIHNWGYNDGFEAGARSRDAEVVKLNGQIKARDVAEKERVDATNKRIDELEGDSRALSATIKDLNKQLSEKKTTVITKYIDRFPESAKACGWDAPTTDTIRELLEQ